MPMKEQRKFIHNPQLNVGLLHAFHVEFAYPRPSHDHYVIGLIERGVQSFTHKGAKYVTPPGGLILINPGVVHTGEAVTGQGFYLRSLYPTVTHMQAALYELTGRPSGVPFFREVRVDDPMIRRNVFAMHEALVNQAGVLESESRFVATLAQLIKRYAEVRPVEQPLGNERHAVKQVRRYIEAHFAESISLSDLAEQVALSPYYLLRVFRSEVGMPPHAYQQDVRIRQAQRLIELGRPLAEVSFAVGFSSQSHLTRCFKKIVSVTPGQYAQQIRSHDPILSRRRSTFTSEGTPYRVCKKTLRPSLSLT